MRKLAREAVIFMLLTPVVVFVGSFAYLYHNTPRPVVLDMNKAQPIQGLPPGTVLVPIPPGATVGPPDTTQSQAPVYLDDNGNPLGSPPASPAKAQNSGATVGQPLPSPQSLLQPGETLGTPVPAASPVVSQAPDPWSVTSQKPAPILELLGDSLLFGLYGFPVGFGLWTFYRIVRFAIKG